MRFINDNEGFTLYIHGVKLDDIDNLKKYIKEKVLVLKKKYFKDISGFYNVDVYSNDRIGLIISFKREEGFDFLRDIVDLNVKVHDKSLVYFEFDDIFLIDSFNDVYFFNNNFYIDISCLNDIVFFKLIEFGKFIYGESLEKLKTKLNLVVKNS